MWNNVVLRKSNTVLILNMMQFKTRWNTEVEIYSFKCNTNSVFFFIESGKNFLDSSYIAANTGLSAAPKILIAFQTKIDLPPEVVSPAATAVLCWDVFEILNLLKHLKVKLYTVYVYVLVRSGIAIFFFFKCLFQGRVESAEAAFTRARDAAWNGP